jgi:hypothetical protein
MWRVLRRTPGIELFRRPAATHRPQGLAARRDGEHPVRWAWSSHRHHEGLALLARADLPDTEIIRFTRPACYATVAAHALSDLETQVLMPRFVSAIFVGCEIGEAAMGGSRDGRKPPQAQD